LRGAFYVSDRPDAVPAAYRELFVGASPETARPCRIESTTVLNGRPLLKCSLAADRTAAEGLTGQYLYVDEQRLLPADDELDGDAEVGDESGDDEDGASPVHGIVHWYELEGLEVVDATGAVLGKVDYVYNAGASDVISLVAADGRTLDLPLVDDYVDLDTPPDAGRIKLRVAADVFEELWQAAPSGPS
jgi:ribosomal 30S subunit maturation factor RimM